MIFLMAICANGTFGCWVPSIDCLYAAAQLKEILDTPFSICLMPESTKDSWEYFR